MRSTACCSCSYLKAVVQIRLAPTKQLKQALQRIRQQEKGTPKFVLRDMDSFMRAQRSLLLRIARDDDVAQGDSRKWQTGYCIAEHCSARRQADFQHTADATDLCAAQARKAGCADTDCRGWRGPYIFECGGGGHGGFVEVSALLEREVRPRDLLDNGRWAKVSLSLSRVFISQHLSSLMRRRYGILNSLFTSFRFNRVVNSANGEVLFTRRK